MIEHEVVEPCESPWASAYVVVKKKNGDMRICIDFRKLNEVTKKSSYPLPNAEDCLEPLIGNCYFSLLDLASGYWQIPLTDRAKPLTSFRTESGQFQFKRMPFGLCNAPASFQRLVNALFVGLKGIHLQVFIDDICVATPTWEGHLRMLNQVFKLLIKPGLKLKPNKCNFVCEQITFLGHVLDSSGIRADPDKVAAIEKLKAPTNVEEVQRIHGLLNYYRRLIPNFAQIAFPFTKLLRQNQTFVWESEQEEAFQIIKEALTRDPVLGQFNHSDPIILKTDACKIGVAGILLQHQHDDWRMITCVSRNTTPAEQKWATIDLEGLAIIYCVKRLRNYLLGHHFTILADHCALCALKSKMSTSARLQRWALILSEFDYSIKYIKGQLHNDVDCLSRAPVDRYEDPYLEEKILAAIETKYSRQRTKIICLVVPNNISQWKELSTQDNEATQHYTRARARQKGYRLSNALLYYENRLFVPQPLRANVMSEAHDIRPSGHGGIHATLNRLAEYWWPKMAEDVSDYVASCGNCQHNKLPRQKPIGQMIVGTFVSNVWTTVMQNMRTNQGINQIKTSLESAHARIEELNKAENLTTMELRAIHDLDNVQSRLLQEHIATTEHFVSGTTVISLVTADLIARMHLLGSYIDIIHNAGSPVTERKIEINYLSLMLDTNLLNDLDPTNIQAESISFQVMDPSTFVLSFSGFRHSLDTKVYEISGFKHVGNLLENTPVLYQYNGPENVVYNSTANCVKGLDEHFGKFVLARCAEKNYEDKRLSEWRELAVGDPTTFGIKTQVKMAWPYVLLYCYTRNITIEDTLLQCPPFAFQIRMTWKWFTDDYGEYVPSAVQINTQVMFNFNTAKIHEVHFEMHNHFVSLAAAERKVRETLSLLEKVKLETHVKIPWINFELSYLILFQLASIGCIVLLIYWVFRWVVELNAIKTTAKADARSEAARIRRRSADKLKEKIYETMSAPKKTTSRV